MNEEADKTLMDKRDYFGVTPSAKPVARPVHDVASADVAIDAAGSATGRRATGLPSSSAHSVQQSISQLPHRLQASKCWPYAIHERFKAGTAHPGQSRICMDPAHMSRIRKTAEHADLPIFMNRNSAALAKLGAGIRQWLQLRDGEERKSPALQIPEPVSATALENLWHAMALHTQMLGKGDREFLTGDVVLSRFANVQAPLATALHDLSGGSFTKLHASRVDMGTRHAFIAAQKPVVNPPPGSACGFWMAVQVEKVALLIDLTNDSDNAGELHYGPMSKNQVWERDSVAVRMHGQEKFELGSVENLEITTNNVRGAQVTARLKFDAWRDHGVITSAQLIFLASKAESLCPPDAPILVHCRAGVGRTGTLMSYMAADDLIRQELQTHKDIPVDRFLAIVLHCVIHGRYDRGPMFVQTDEQFQLLLNALVLRHAVSLV